MTDIGYDNIIKKIEEMKLQATPQNCRLAELYNWAQGYAAAVHDITCMIIDLKESNTQRK